MALPRITANSLTEMRAIAPGHPVYRIKIGGLDYSLKAESSGDMTASSDVKWASKIMHNVSDKKSDDAKIRLLSEYEIDALAGCYMNFNLSGAETIVLEETLTTSSNVWYIMHWQPQLFNSGDQMNQGEIDQLFAIVNGSAFWKKLGKIIAVDLFTGNNDRFDFANYTHATPQDFWSNKGNLFMNVSNLNSVSPIGLDFYFNQNSFGKDMISDQNYIQAMRSKTEIGTIAGLIVDSIMDELTGKNLGEKTGRRSKFTSYLKTKLSTSSTTEERYKKALRDEIWSALEDVKKYLVNKRREYARNTPPPQPQQPQPNWQNNPVAQPQQNWQNNPLNQRQVPNLPNHNPHRPGNTAPVSHNNTAVSKTAFPANIEARMQALNWI